MDNPDILNEFNKEKSLRKLYGQYVKCLESLIMGNSADFINFPIKQKINLLNDFTANKGSSSKNFFNIDDFFNMDFNFSNFNNQNFASSKINLQSSFNILSKTNDSITISLKNVKITLKEYDEFFKVEKILKNKISTYLDNNKNKEIFQNDFSVSDILVKRTFLIDGNNFFVNYWFTKFNKLFCYAVQFDVDNIDSIIKNHVLKKELSKHIYLGGNGVWENKFVLKDYGEFLNEDYMVNSVIKDYLEPFDSEVIKTNLLIDGGSIEKTVIFDNNVLFINYWFIKNNRIFSYQSYFNICELDELIFNLINSTSQGFVNFKKLFTLNFLDILNKNTVSCADSFNVLDSFKNKLSIILLVSNPIENIEGCIDSILNNTLVEFNLYIIDNSDLKGNNHVLKKYENYENIYFINNDGNYINKINSCIRLDKNDVIILESNVTVFDKWDQKFLFSAYSNDKIATVTPMSNIDFPNYNFDIFQDDFNKINRLMENISDKTLLKSPIGRDFCIFIKRDALTEIGYFDEKNKLESIVEFTINAHLNGWKNIVCDSLFIFYNGNLDFSFKFKHAIENNHLDFVQKKYPLVYNEWLEFIQSEMFNNIFLKFDFILNNYDESLIKKNILYVTDLNEGLPVVDDIDILSKKFNVFCLTLRRNRIKFWCYSSNQFVFINESPFSLETPNLSKINLFYFNLFNCFNIDFIFIRFSGTFGMSYCQDITPIMFASRIKRFIYYGRSTKYLLNQLNYLPNNSEKHFDFKNERGVVYTAIFGDYESLLDPKIVDSNLDYICFTDNPNITSDIWEIRLVTGLDMDNTRKARTIKTLPHKYLQEYDFSIWIDAAFQIVGDLEEYANIYSQKGIFLAITHSWRDCIYDEADAVINANKDDTEIVKNQMHKYESEGFPKKYGLIESGVLIRRHNDNQVIKVMEDWNKEIMGSSKRDQLSFNYVSWKNNFSYDKVPLFCWKNQFLDHYHHTSDAKDNKVTIPYLRIFLIANNNYESTKISIDAINNINYNIPISIISLNDYSSFEDYNIMFHRIHYNDILTEELNSLIKSSNEDFIFLIKSGDVIQYEVIEKLLEFRSRWPQIAAFIFDEVISVDGSILFDCKPKFSNDIYSNQDYFNNKAILNRNILLSNGGFENVKSFVSNSILDMSYGYDIIKLNIFGLNSFKKLV